MRAGRAMLVFCLHVGAFAPQAHAQSPIDYGPTGDYAPSGDAWNALGRFIERASEESANVMTPEIIDVATLRPDDALAIFYPRGGLPTAAIHRFLLAGGRVLIADDFGNGSELLDTYQIVRKAPSQATAERLSGNRNLLVAKARGDHPLTEGIDRIVTNHPAVVVREGLEPVFVLGESTDAVVLVGAVGKGRLVALSDPSVLINNMLEFRQNRAFAGNLARYLVGTGTGRLFVVTPQTRWSGGGPGSIPSVKELEEWLTASEQEGIPDALVRFGSLGTALILIVAVVAWVPRKSPYGLSLLVGPAQRAAMPSAGRGSEDGLNHHDGLVELRDELRSVVSKSSRPEAARLLAELDEVIRRRLASGHPYTSGVELLRYSRQVQDVVHRARTS